MKVRNSIMLVSLTVLGACQAVAPTGEVPAVLTQSTPASARELRETVGEILGREHVLLAQDALLTDNVLIVERRPRPSLATGGDLGRNRDKPDHFRLFMHGNTCILEHQQSGTRRNLEYAQCQPQHQNN